tara:strand:- start:41 stop:694 length:654 start_codon:yes stop_codon:yes gene_type:complete
MVDTLAPKKIYKQRDLDKSLTPSPVAAALMTPAQNVIDVAPKGDKPNPLLNMAQVDYLVNADIVTNQMNEKTAPSVKERQQTVRSSEETVAEKQTGKEVVKDVPQGLVAKPAVMYAREGLTDTPIDSPLVVGEDGPEMIIPTGKGKFTVIPNEALQGIMSRITTDKESPATVMAQGPAYSEEEMEILRDSFFEGPASDFQSFEQYLNSQRARDDLSS